MVRHESETPLTSHEGDASNWDMDGEEELVYAQDDSPQYSKFSNRQRWLILFLGACCAFLNPLTMTFFIPAQPTIQRVFEAGSLTTVLCIQIFPVMTGICPFLVSPLSDRIGRRPVLLIALPIYLVGMFLSPFANSIGLLILGRVIAGIGIAPVLAICTGALFDTFPPERRALGLGILMVPTTVAPLIGPVLGGLITEELSWEWTIWVPALVSVPVVALVLIFYPETLDTRPWMASRQELPSINPLVPIGKYLFSHPIFWFITARALSMSATLTVVPMSNAVLAVYPNNFTPFGLGLTAIPFSLGAIVGAGIGGGFPNYFVKRFGVKAAGLIPGIISDSLLSISLMAWSQLVYSSAWGAVGFTAVIGAFSFISRTSYFSTVISFYPDLASTLSALIQLWTFLSVGIWSLLSPLILDKLGTVTAVFSILGILIDAALIPVAYIVIRGINNPPSEAEHYFGNINAEKTSSSYKEL